MVERNNALIAWHKPQSGTICLLELKKGIDAFAFFTALRKEKGILVMPGAIIDCPKHFFRIGLGRENLATILPQFEAFLHEYARR